MLSNYQFILQILYKIQYEISTAICDFRCQLTEARPLSTHSFSTPFPRHVTLILCLPSIIAISGRLSLPDHSNLPALYQPDPSIQMEACNLSITQPVGQIIQNIKLGTMNSHLYRWSLPAYTMRHDLDFSFSFVFVTFVCFRSFYFQFIYIFAHICTLR